MVQRKGSGLGKRVGYLDRETVAENRAILREFERSQTSSAPTRTERPQRGRGRLLEVARRSRRDDVRSAAEILAERLSEGEKPAEATTAAERALYYVHGDEAPRNVQRDWERARDAVLSAWATSVGRDTPEAQAVLASLPQKPAVDLVVRDALIAAGKVDPSWEEVERGGIRLAELLASGFRFGPASAKAWKNIVARVEEEDRKALGRHWAQVSRLIQNEWAKSHPEDAPAAPVRPALSTETLRTQLESAGATVRSWPLLQPEGAMVVSLLAEGASVPDAVSAARSELDTRREKVSESEWQLIVHEWDAITEALGRAHRRLSRKTAPRR